MSKLTIDKVNKLLNANENPTKIDKLGPEIYNGRYLVNVITCPISSFERLHRYLKIQNEFAGTEVVDATGYNNIFWHREVGDLEV